MLAGSPALRLEPTQAFGEFFHPLFATGFREPFDHLLQTRLEAFREALVHGVFLLGAGGGVAIQPDLRAGFIAPELSVDRFPGGGFDRDGGARIELPLALAAHHQIPIPFRLQPGEILF